MSRLNALVIKILVVLALLPLAPAIIGTIAAISPLLPFALLLVLGWMFIPGFRPVGWLLSALRGLFRTVGAVLFGTLGVAGKCLGFLFGMLSFQNRGARFMGFFERMLLLSASNYGFLVDGHKRRLSRKNSFQSVLTVGGMGRGKSSVFVMPNLYTLDDCSFVVSDTSGEIYQQTSGYLASKGFQVRVLNLMNPAESETYSRTSPGRSSPLRAPDPKRHAGSLPTDDPCNPWRGQIRLSDAPCPTCRCENCKPGRRDP